MMATKATDIGSTHCRGCATTTRLFLVKTGVKGTVAIKMLVCQKCDRYKPR